MAAKTATMERISQLTVPGDRLAAMEDLVRHFAAVSGQTPDEMRHEIIQMGGDMVITDKEAKAILARLEDQYHCEDIFRVTDLCPSSGIDVGVSSEKPGGRGGCVDPAEDTSLCGLLDIIAGKLGL